MNFFTLCLKSRFEGLRERTFWYCVNCPRKRVLATMNWGITIGPNSDQLTDEIPIWDDSGTDWWLCEKLIQIDSQISSRTDSDQLELTQISLNWLRSVLYSAKPRLKRPPKSTNFWNSFWSPTQVERVMGIMARPQVPILGYYWLSKVSQPYTLSRLLSNVLAAYIQICASASVSAGRAKTLTRGMAIS